MSAKRPLKAETMREEQWRARGAELFGADEMQWRFTCPGCGHVASVQDWKDADAPPGAVAFSCVGRWIEGSRDWMRGKGPGPCNYSGGGLFGLNPVVVTLPDGSTQTVFAFATAEVAP